MANLMRGKTSTCEDPGPRYGGTNGLFRADGDDLGATMVAPAAGRSPGMAPTTWPEEAGSH